MAEWVLRSRMAIVSHPDTPFIEAMVLGIPTLGLRDVDRWEMRPDAAELFAELAAVGVIYSDPGSVAEFVDRIHPDPNAGWRRPEIQAARKRFLDRFAAPGGWKSAWTKALRLAAAD